APEPDTDEPVLEAKHTTVHYGAKMALRDINLDVAPNTVTAIMGPVSSGKTTLLRTFNRLIDLNPGARITGSVAYRGRDIYASGVDPGEVRRRIGMIFRTPAPFPRSIGANVSWGARVNGLTNREDVNGLVERSLTRAGLWRDVKDRLHASPVVLTPG